MVGGVVTRRSMELLVYPAIFFCGARAVSNRLSCVGLKDRICVSHLNPVGASAQQKTVDRLSKNVLRNHIVVVANSK